MSVNPPSPNLIFCSLPTGALKTHLGHGLVLLAHLGQFLQPVWGIISVLSWQGQDFPSWAVGRRDHNYWSRSKEGI